MRSTFTTIVLFFLGLCSYTQSQAQVICLTYPCVVCSRGGELKVDVPNVFTPNHDDINDYWLPKVSNQECLSDYYLTVFNRWGKRLFETTVYSTGWNGNEVADGLHCPEGTYYYMLHYTNAYTKETKKAQGFFLLTR